MMKRNRSEIEKAYIFQVNVKSFWSRVLETKDGEGSKRFSQLAALINSLLTLSHGNAGPEQGFSINKAIIDSHGI